MLTLAWDTEVATVAMKLVLVSLADQANSAGMCWPGYGFISKRTGLHRNTVIKSIQKLEKNGLLTKAHREGNGCSKSNMYTLHLDGSSTAQLPSNSKPLPSNAELPPQSHRVTRGGGAELPKPLYNHQLEPPKNHYRSNDFDRWWSIYPKKVGKKPAQTAWKRIKPDADVLIADIQERLARDDQWKRGYVPNPTTYLNQERWTDELQQPKRNESTPADEYAARVTRENEIISKLNGGSMAVDGEVVSPTVDEEQRGDWITCLPRLDA